MNTSTPEIVIWMSSHLLETLTLAVTLSVALTVTVTVKIVRYVDKSKLTKEQSAKEGRDTQQLMDAKDPAVAHGGSGEGNVTGAASGSEKSVGAAGLVVQGDMIVNPIERQSQKTSTGDEARNSSSVSFVLGSTQRRIVEELEQLFKNFGNVAQDLFDDYNFAEFCLRNRDWDNAAMKLIPIYQEAITYIPRSSRFQTPQAQKELAELRTVLESITQMHDTKVWVTDSTSNFRGLETQIERVFRNKQYVTN